MTVATKHRVLIVNTDVFLRQGLTRLLAANVDVDVVASAMNGRTGLPKVLACKPDCVVVDLEHDEVGGLHLLEQTTAVNWPLLRIAVVSPSVKEDAVQAAQRCVGVEVIRRVAGSGDDVALLRLVKSIAGPLLRRGTRSAAPVVAVPAPSSPPALQPNRPHPALSAVAAGVGAAPRILGIGVSTGGPKALAQFLPMLPADFPMPVVVVQHMPPKFTKSLADSLDQACKLRVREAVHGDRVERGVVLVAPGGYHMRVATSANGEIVQLTEDPPECSCRPSVNYLFRSLVAVFGGHTIAVVLTGMGEDGWMGSSWLHDAGAQILAQDESTSVVYGMPRGPIEAGIARAVRIERMAEAVLQCARRTP